MNRHAVSGLLRRAAQRVADLHPVRSVIEQRRLRRHAAAWTAHHDRLRAFYARFVGAGDICFDVGANLGDRTRVFRDLGARVVAVEPHPACARALKDVYRGDPTVSVEHVALSDAPGTGELHLGSAHVLSTMSMSWMAANQRSGRLASSRWDRTVHVTVRTLDQLVQQYGVPDFVKIDVEGSEARVLGGLSTPARCLSFEFTVECLDLAVECLGRARQIGFTRANYSFGESLRLELPQWTSCEALGRILTERAHDADGIGDVYVGMPTE